MLNLLLHDHHEAEEASGLHVLVGRASGIVYTETLRRLGWGRMFSMENPNPWEGEKWGFDNGAYIHWTQESEFDADAYKRRLERAYKIGMPYLAVVPDIVAGGLRSLEFSMSWMDRMPNDWPLYLAVQDGMTREDVEGVIRAGFAGVFLGGSDKFKKSAPMWSDLAHSYGLKFHYGRAGTLRKLGLAREAEADSLDSTRPVRSRKDMDDFVERLKTGDPQMLLPIGRNLLEAV